GGHERTPPPQPETRGRLFLRGQYQQLVCDGRKALELAPTFGALRRVLEHACAILSIGNAECDLGCQLTDLSTTIVSAHQRPPASRAASASPCGCASWRFRVVFP